MKIGIDSRKGICKRGTEEERKAHGRREKQDGRRGWGEIEKDETGKKA